jgi:subtilisin family serine protease
VAPNESVPLEKKPAAPNRSEATAPEPDLTTLLKLVPTEDIKARSFVRANPSYDGRGVLIAILDTGVEVDHPMLSKTSTGEDKIVDSRDFSGQGHVDLAPAIVTEDGTLVVPTGGHFSVAGMKGTEFSFGFFHGSTLQYSAEVASKDTFRDVAVLRYRTPAGRRARLDLDGDGNFTNDVEIHDFAESRRFVKLGTQGTLTAAVNLADDGTSAPIVFDVGTHGSHVAGIAAGYDPKGLGRHSWCSASFDEDRRQSSLRRLDDHRVDGARHRLGRCERRPHRQLELRHPCGLERRCFGHRSVHRRSRPEIGNAV